MRATSFLTDGLKMKLRIQMEILWNPLKIDHQVTERVI